MVSREEWGFNLTGRILIVGTTTFLLVNELVVFIDAQWRCAKPSTPPQVIEWISSMAKDKERSKEEEDKECELLMTSHLHVECLSTCSEGQLFSSSIYNQEFRRVAAPSEPQQAKSERDVSFVRSGRIGVGHFRFSLL